MVPGVPPIVQSVLKLENKPVQTNFLTELAKQFDKYRDKKPSQLIKLLFFAMGRGRDYNK